MPQVRDENFTCFVQGHGAKYASDRAPGDTKQTISVIADAAASPIALERVRLLAAAQLAFQRVAQRSLKRK